MKKIIKQLLIALTFIGFSITASKALVLDVYTIDGVDTQAKRAQMVEGFNSFKENAVNGGAKWIDFTLNVKIRGDGYREQFTFAVIYENASDMMETHEIFAANQQWFDPFEFDAESARNAIFETPPGVDIDYQPAQLGQTLWYSFINVTDLLNFLNRAPQIAGVLEDAGMKGQFGILNCTLCPASLGDTTHMMFLTNESATTMGEDLDALGIDEAIWFYRNVRPFAEQIDVGMNSVIAN